MPGELDSSTYVDPVDAALNESIDAIPDEAFPSQEAIDADIKKAGGEPTSEEEPTDEISETETETPPEEGESDEPVVGTEDNPYTVHDFGEDEFVRIKIDGEEQVVSLRKALDAGISRATLDKRAPLMKKKTQEAEQLANQATETLSKYKKGIVNTFSDKKSALHYLNTHFPHVLDEIVLEHYPHLYEADKAGKLDHFLSLRKLKHQEKTLEQQRRLDEEQRKQKQAQDQTGQRRTLLLGALKETLKDNAFEKPDPELLGEIGEALNARERRSGRILSQDEVTQVVRRWLRAHTEGTKPRERKPRRGKAPRSVQGKRGKDTSGAKKTEKYDEWGDLSADFILRTGGN